MVGKVAVGRIYLNLRVLWCFFFYQLGAQILYLNTLITSLYMFQALLCSSSGGRIA